MNIAIAKCYVKVCHISYGPSHNHWSHELLLEVSFSMRAHALPFITKLALLFQVGFIVLEEWHIKIKVT